MNIDLAEGLQWFLVFIFSTSWHEAAHAWVAHKLGDSTAYHGRFFVELVLFAKLAAPGAC
jgi:hypothetical protein